MIELFKNIHKKLLEQGKTINYLKYAIAENMHSVLSKKKYNYLLVDELKKQEFKNEY